MYVLNRTILTVTRYKQIFQNADLLIKNTLCIRHSNERRFIFSTKVYLNNTPNEDQKTNLNNPVINYDVITKGNKELEHKLKVIMLETEVLRQEGHLVPPSDYFNNEMWESLLNLPSRTSRKRQLEFFFKNAKKKESRIAKKLEKQKLFEEFKSSKSGESKFLSIEEHAFCYGLSFNNIFLRFHDTAVNRFYNSRLVQAMQYGQKIVIDCGYDQNMSRRENYNCAKQIMFLFAENRVSDQPFDIHYVNFNRGSELEVKLRKYIPTMYDPEFPMNIHEKSYLDLFPKENLVYLTPHCREDMESYDPDAIYIIGGIVDKVNNEPLSLAKAKREGIKMKRFPMDRYLQWGAGSGKSLTLNQCVSILLDIKDTGDWTYALRHVPKRKLSEVDNSSQNFYSSPADVQKYKIKKNNWKPKFNNRPSYMND